jgi:hypothetical protein
MTQQYERVVKENKINNEGAEEQSLCSSVALMQIANVIWRCGLLVRRI